MSYFSFPTSSGLVYSVMDCTFMIGYTLGPVLGAALYQTGGFMTPFLVCGSTISVNSRHSLLIKWNIYLILSDCWECVCMEVFPELDKS